MLKRTAIYMPRFNVAFYLKRLIASETDRCMFEIVSIYWSRGFIT